MNSRDYWAQREEEQLRHNLNDEREYSRQIEKIYQDMLDKCQREIDAFYGRYASAEGITIAEAKKRVSKMDIAAYERKAARYVKEKNFSKQANVEMRLYNAAMKINRLELLKANIGLELLAGHAEMESFMAEILQGRTMDELRRQAGILGESVKNNAKAARAIVNSSFHNATFSDRIWMYQDLLRNELSSLLQSGLIQGKGSAELARELRKRFNVKVSDAERLMITELRRVQTEAAKQSYERNGNEEYIFLALNPEVNSVICDECKKLDGQHFKVADMKPGENAPPMHPRCHCSTAPYVDRKEYEAWLDFLSKGGTTAEWNRLQSERNSAMAITYRKKRLDEGIFITYNFTNADSVRPKSISKELSKSEIGMELLSYLQTNNVPVKLCYGVDNPNGYCGQYDPFDDEIIIYGDVTKSTVETAITVIHEATHRKLGSTHTFEEEVECYKAEFLHKNGGLTKKDIEFIINHVKKYYPELE